MKKGHSIPTLHFLLRAKSKGEIRAYLTYRRQHYYRGGDTYLYATREDFSGFNPDGSPRVERLTSNQKLIHSALSVIKRIVLEWISVCIAEGQEVTPELFKQAMEKAHDEVRRMNAKEAQKKA